jgi:hypothetical protein
MRNSNPHLMTKVLLEQYSRIEKQQRGVWA